MFDFLYSVFKIWWVYSVCNMHGFRLATSQLRVAC